MKWLIPVLLSGVIVVAAIAPAWRDRAEVVGRVSVPTCTEDLGMDAAGSSSLTWRLRLADDLDGTRVELSDDQLIGLGFDRHAVAMLGMPRPTDMEWPAPRPVWVRLRADSSRGGRLAIDSVGVTREGLGVHADAIVVQARLGFSAHPEVTRAVPGDSVVAPAKPQGGVLHVDLLELIPPLLHLTAADDAALRKVPGDAECHGSHTAAVVAMGRRGSLWVERLVTR